MGLRRHATTEVRTGRSMSKGPDLSAFPIPRKGGAKPIAMDEAAQAAAVEEQEGGQDRHPAAASLSDNTPTDCHSRAPGRDGGNQASGDPADLATRQRPAAHAKFVGADCCDDSEIRRKPVP